MDSNDAYCVYAPISASNDEIVSCFVSFIRLLNHVYRIISFEHKYTTVVYFNSWMTIFSSNDWILWVCFLYIKKISNITFSERWANIANESAVQIKLDCSEPNSIYMYRCIFISGWRNPTACGISLSGHIHSRFWCDWMTSV